DRLKEVTAANKESAAAEENNQKALARQEQALFRVNERYLDVQNIIKATVKDKITQNKALEDAKVAFEAYEKAMTGGVLSSAEFNRAQNEVTKQLNAVKRVGVEEKIAHTNFQMQELTKSVQIA